MYVTCPNCGVSLKIVPASLPPDRIVACPNRCGLTWFAEGRVHYFPQLLRVHVNSFRSS